MNTVDVNFIIHQLADGITLLSATEQAAYVVAEDTPGKFVCRYCLH